MIQRREQGQEETTGAFWICEKQNVFMLLPKKDHENTEVRKHERQVMFLTMRDQYAWRIFYTAFFHVFVLSDFRDYSLKAWNIHWRFMPPSTPASLP